MRYRLSQYLAARMSEVKPRMSTSSIRSRSFSVIFVSNISKVGMSLSLAAVNSAMGWVEEEVISVERHFPYI